MESAAKKHPEQWNQRFGEKKLFGMKVGERMRGCNLWMKGTAAEATKVDLLGYCTVEQSERRTD